MTDYSYSRLTSELDDKNSPLRRYLVDRFPNTRPLQNEYKANAGRLLVESGDANPGTLGTAFDLRIRFLLDPTHVPQEAFSHYFADKRGVEAITEVISIASSNPSDSQMINRACWALALCSEFFRAGPHPGSALYALWDNEEVTADKLMSLVPPDACRQLDELMTLAETRLLPWLSGPHYLGPTFDASSLCAADADLISNGLLIDLKTRIGKKNAGGERYDVLSLEDLYQAITYALFDRTDEYSIKRIGIYSARYGSLTTWDLGQALETLAKGSISLDTERTAVWTLLSS